MVYGNDIRNLHFRTNVRVPMALGDDIRNVDILHLPQAASPLAFRLHSGFGFGVPLPHPPPPPPHPLSLCVSRSRLCIAISAAMIVIHKVADY